MLHFFGFLFLSLEICFKHFIKKYEKYFTNHYIKLHKNRINKRKLYFRNIKLYSSKLKISCFLENQLSFARNEILK